MATPSGSAAATSPPPVPAPASEAPRASPTLTPNNAAAGTKRKRVTEKKFYAVREGKTPGIYNTWDECLAQVRGHKGSVCMFALAHLDVCH